MRDSDRRPWSPADFAIRLTILALAALLLLALQQTGRLEGVEGAVVQVTTPGQITLTGVTDRVASLFETVNNFRNLQQRVAELEQISDSLLVENLRLQEVERENQRLRELLGFAETRPGIQYRSGQILARSIGFDSNNFLNYIMLDLGRQHGIAVGMPVVNDQGLVGRISEVNESTSKVLLITDADSTVNAILQSSRLTGVITGRPGEDPVMGFIPQGSEVSVGEIVLTSGMGGNFPKGIPIGQVTEVRQRDFDVFQEATIRPTVDFGRLELVMIITNFDPLEIVEEFDIIPQFPANVTPPDDASPANGAVNPAESAPVTTP
ncbi:MAG: rod shape-determining protein MreC [Caldilineaceae bacterium]|nr:rod shape-determining protein MreC [Caldilineaceae bacterium]